MWERFHWDLGRKNKLMGAVALGFGIFMGPRRVELVKVLLEHGASIDYRTDSGGSILTNLCENEDCSPELLRFSKRNENHHELQNSCEYRKWRIIHRLEQINKIGLLPSRIHSLAVQNHVNLLLKHGADPSIKKRESHPWTICDAFPELRVL